MGRKQFTSPPEPTPPTSNPDKSRTFLLKQKDKAISLLDNSYLSNEEVSAWKNTTRELLKEAFGSDSSNIGAVINAGNHRIINVYDSDYRVEQDRRNNLTASIMMLDSCIEQLDAKIELGTTPPDIHKENGKKVFNEKKIFVVHGHDRELMLDIARTIDKMGLNAILLNEMSNRGQTIIEKLESNSDVGFAVVLLTPDDLGKAKDEIELRPRARQNVLIELGYFVGMLGRERVFLLYSEGVEIPSDFDGVMYELVDGGGSWKFKLARELKETGYKLDLNNLL